MSTHNFHVTSLFSSRHISRLVSLKCLWLLLSNVVFASYVDRWNCSSTLLSILIITLLLHPCALHQCFLAKPCTCGSHWQVQLRVRYHPNCTNSLLNVYRKPIPYSNSWHSYDTFPGYNFHRHTINATKCLMHSQRFYKPICIIQQKHIHRFNWTQWLYYELFIGSNQISHKSCRQYF